MRNLFVLLGLIVISCGYAQDLSKVQQALSKKDTTKALKLINTMIEKSPQAPDLYMERAKIKIARKEYDPAMADLNSYCSMKKTCVDGIFYKGLIRYKQGDYNGAIAHFSETDSEHKDTPTWTYLALCHMKIGNYNLAANIFDRILEYDPKNIAALYNGALANYNDGNYGKASEYFQKCIDANAKDQSSMFGKALSEMMLQHYDESIALLDGILKINPKDAVAIYNKGLNFYNLNENEKACTTWSQASELGNATAKLAVEQFCGK